MGMSSLTGGGGFSASAGGGTSRSGDAAVNSGTGAKTFNIGGNPNITSGKLTPVFIAAAVVAVVFLWRRNK